MNFKIKKRDNISQTSTLPATNTFLILSNSTWFKSCDSFSKHS